MGSQNPRTAFGKSFTQM
jgi:hypothetical protein